MNFELRNPKLETSSNFEARKGARDWLAVGHDSFAISNFGVRICFELRVSIFEF